MRNTSSSTHKQQLTLMKIAVLFSLLMWASIACVNLHAGDASLTESHEEEARLAIENFELRWYSLEAHKEPSIQSEVATDPYLHYVGYAREGKAIYDEPSWLIIKSVVIDGLTVLEYTDNRLKITAHIVRQIDEITPQGELRQSLPAVKSCGVYVFVRESNAWKLAGLFDMTNINNVLRDWRDAPDWLHQIIGDLPQSGCAD